LKRKKHKLNNKDKNLSKGEMKNEKQQPTLLGKNKKNYYKLKNKASYWLRNKKINYFKIKKKLKTG
jgi:hypothetical protein